MKDAFKSIDKKYLYFIGVVFGVIILVLIIVAVTKGCSKPGKNYSKVEEKMVDAARKFYKEHKDMIPAESNKDTVKITTLVDTGYMKGLSKYLEDPSCTGEVTIYNNGGQYLLVPNLVCSEYKTNHLVDQIKKDSLVSENGNNNEIVEGTQSGGETNEIPVGSEPVQSKDYISGLYNDNGVYVFKGKNPNNYLLFGNIKWRIIDINENNIIRVVKVDYERNTERWDTKYNVEQKSSKGINDYKNSGIHDKLVLSYNKFKDDNKAHLAPFNVCVGKREHTNLSIDRSLDCSEVLENQYIGLISGSDFARASLDENCDSIKNGACRNYNYLSDFLFQTWTSNAVSDDTFNVIYINSGYASKQSADMSISYHQVVAINGDELYISGKGTADSPYVVGKNKKSKK